MRRLRHPTPLWRATLWLLLAAWLAFMGYMTLTATQPASVADATLRSAVGAATGHTSSVSTGRGVWEGLSNVALSVPLGFLVGLLLPRHRWLAVLACTLTSGAIELLQATVVTTRQASFGDVLHNAVGGLVGWLLALVVVWVLRRSAVTPRRRSPDRWGAR